MSAQNKRVKVRELPIRLGQFLKLADIVQDGIEAKLMIQNGEVLVNGAVETRRGKQLQHLDQVSVDGRVWLIEVRPPD